MDDATTSSSTADKAEALTFDPKEVFGEEWRKVMGAVGAIGAVASCLDWERTWKITTAGQRSLFGKTHVTLSLDAYRAIARSLAWTILGAEYQRLASEAETVASGLIRDVTAQLGPKPDGAIGFDLETASMRSMQSNAISDLLGKLDVLRKLEALR